MQELFFSLRTKSIRQSINYSKSPILFCRVSNFLWIFFYNFVWLLHLPKVTWVHTLFSTNNYSEIALRGPVSSKDHKLCKTLKVNPFCLRSNFYFVFYSFRQKYLTKINLNVYYYINFNNLSFGFMVQDVKRICKIAIVPN